uniref:THAP-type domain-containing protein n=1 Tax=Ixodes ricinus TaxID=34613 RepID=A0A0K8RLC7_IXORI
MPTHCCVPVCTQYGYVDKSGRKVSYHRFPGDAEIKKKWIAAIKRDEGPLFQVSKSTKVCSFHFLHTDFFTNVASGHRLLRESAVPSVFPFRKTKPPRKPPRQRTASSAQKSKKSKEQHVPADADSQPQMEEECPEFVKQHST